MINALNQYAPAADLTRVRFLPVNYILVESLFIRQATSSQAVSICVLSDDIIHFPKHESDDVHSAILHSGRVHFTIIFRDNIRTVGNFLH